MAMANSELNQLAMWDGLAVQLHSAGEAGDSSGHNDMYPHVRAVSCSMTDAGFHRPRPPSTWQQ
jgi:hypothetical protein